MWLKNNNLFKFEILNTNPMKILKKVALVLLIVIVLLGAGVYGYLLTTKPQY